MASKQVSGSPNGNLGKRKKPRASRGSYLTKWLDKTMHHIQDSTPSMDTYDSFINSNLNWPSNSQFGPGYDHCRLYCNPEPMSLPALPTYYTPPIPHPHYAPEYRYIQSANKSIQVQRPRQRRRGDKPEEIHCIPMATPNGTLNKNYKNLTECQDFASLPPIVTSVGDTTSNSDLNTNEKEDNRRFSDPCINGLPNAARPANGDVESGSEESSTSGSQVGGRLLSCLLDQIAALKLANDRLSKDLQDTKAELTNVRQHNSVWQKSSSSSLAGTPHHSPLVNNGLLNAQYSPGLLTDLVREIREAARVREEAMYARVRQMVHERGENGITSNDIKLSDRSLEDIKSSLRASEADKRRMMERINKLEDELRLIRNAGLDTKENTTNNGNSNGNTNSNSNGNTNSNSNGNTNSNSNGNTNSNSNGNTNSNSITAEAEAEQLRLRKELADMKRAKHNAEEHTLKLERLVTQLRSKFNGLQLSPSGPESLPSEPEHDASARVRRTSVNSNSTTVVFGPVTDL